MKVFTGFSQELLVDFTELKSWEIRRLRDYGVVQPTRTKSGYRYSFADVMLLRLCRELHYRYEVSLGNIRNAHQYFAELNPEQSLDAYLLFVRNDNKDVLYFGESYDEDRALISASKCGQLAIKGAISILPVGKQLEPARQNVISFDERLNLGLTSSKFFSLKQLKKQYGSG